MPTKHSPLIKLAAARSRYGIATENCPHWDYEGFDCDFLHSCCHELMQAESALKAIKRAIRGME